MYPRLEKYLACKHRNMQNYTEYCFDCGENIWTTEATIIKEEQEKAKIKEAEEFKKNNPNAPEVAPTESSKPKEKEMVTYAIYGLLIQHQDTQRTVKKRGCYHSILAQDNFCSICGKPAHEEFVETISKDEIQKAGIFYYSKDTHSDDSQVTSGIIGFKIAKTSDYGAIFTPSESLKTQMISALNKLNITYFESKIGIYIFSKME